MREFLTRLAATTATAAVLLAPSAPALAAGADTTVAGTLIEVVEHDEHGHGEHDHSAFAIQTPDGDLHPVSADDDVFEDATTGDHVVATLDAPAATDVEREVLEATVTAAAPPAVTTTSMKTYVLAIDDPNASGDVPLSTAITRTQESMAWWARQARGAITGTAIVDARTLSLPNSCAMTNWQVWTEAQRLYPGVPFANGSGNHVIVYSPTSCQANVTYSGIATIGFTLNTGGLLQIIGDNPAIVTHEFGHNFTLGHSNIEYPRINGTFATMEYFGLYGPMAVAVGRIPMSSLDVAYQQRLGMPGAQSAIVTAGNNTLTTAMLSAVDAPGGTRAVTFTEPSTGHTYWVEYRAGTGEDAGTVYVPQQIRSIDGTPTYYKPGVRVYRTSGTDGRDLVTVARRVEATNQTTLTAGQSFTAPSGGFRIDVPAMTTSAAEVKVIVGAPVHGPITSVTSVDPVTSVYGVFGAARVTVTATGVTPTGQVQLTDNSGRDLGTSTLVDGVATFTLPASTVPSARTLTAKYLGSDTVLSSEGTAPWTVSRAQTTTTAADVTAALGKSVNATVTVTSPTASVGGTVEIYNGNTRIAQATQQTGKSATVTIPAGLPVGTHTLTARYGGAAQVAPSSATFTLTVTPAASTTTLTAPDVSYGKLPTLSVQVTSPGQQVTGTVTIRNGTKKIAEASLDADGVTRLTLREAFTAGKHTLSADYSGSTNIAPSTATTTLTVTPVIPKTTATAPNGTLGAPVPVTIDLSPAVSEPAVVVFYNGTTKVGEGVIRPGATTIDLPATLPMGTHDLVARFRGDSNLAASADEFTVTIGKPIAAVNATNVNSTYGTAATVNAEVTVPGRANPTGTVTATQGGMTFGEATVRNGKALITLPATIRTGTHTLTLTYTGPDTDPVTNTFILRVAASTAPTITVPNVHSTYGTAHAVDVTVTTPAGPPAAGTVTLTQNGVRFGEGTLTSGHATVNLPATIRTGTHTLTATYTGDAGTASTTFIIRITNPA